ncbi:ankyrin repeat domain-containing protein [Lentzea tibetensis]|uniref:Ankyrin repeat domain-containing protein n=1 Tax=Lentzea tibetensis TaxID=2591470 RepID=A0A563EMI5_9PSEU|nr:ankyrin repeat domain-containing protein [Lentzea tibetensis]TWP48504.1 ankyrin repeat domain-containing protein [Lentzea tibetensis]
MYTVGSPGGREWLAGDEVVRGRYHHITPDDAPRARLPSTGVVVVHGFGPPATYDHVDPDLVSRPLPWDAFLPAEGDTGGLDAADALTMLGRWHRPPTAMVAWMRELARAAGAPAVLYQCETSGGPPDHESALLVNEKEIAVVVCWDEPGGRAVWPADLQAPDPLQFLLRSLGAEPTGWYFEPHARDDLTGALPWDDPAADRLSLFRACVRGDLEAVDAVLRRGADLHGYPFESPLSAASDRGHTAVVERLRQAGDRRQEDVTPGQ